MAKKYLDYDGLALFWSKIKSKIADANSESGEALKKEISSAVAAETEARESADSAINDALAEKADKETLLDDDGKVLSSALPTIKISEIDTLWTSIQECATWFKSHPFSRFTVVGDNNYPEGTLEVFLDPGRHTAVQVLTSHYHVEISLNDTYQEEGAPDYTHPRFKATINLSAHDDGVVNTIYRIYNISSPTLEGVEKGAWSDWFFPNTPQTNYLWMEGGKTTKVEKKDILKFHAIGAYRNAWTNGSDDTSDDGGCIVFSTNGNTFGWTAEGLTDDEIFSSWSDKNPDGAPADYGTQTNTGVTPSMTKLYVCEADKTVYMYNGTTLVKICEGSTDMTAITDPEIENIFNN